MQLMLAITSVVFSVLAFAGPVSADVTVSLSNDPSAALGAELSALFDQEHRGLTSVHTDTVAKLSMRPKPRGKASKAPVIDYSRKYLNELPKVSGGEEWACLTQALYFEARGEKVKGQFAVAEVILNRVSSTLYPNSVCAVVHQGTGRKFQCQFTFTCDGHKETISEPAAYASVGKVARLMLDGAPRALTEGATHYHTTAVNPRWARKFPLTAKIGVHRFYRHPKASS